MSLHSKWTLACGQDSKICGRTVSHGSGLHQSQMLRKAGLGHCRKRVPKSHKRTQSMEDRNGDHASDITVSKEDLVI